MDKQGSLGVNQDPLFTTDQINAKTNELTKIISPIMHKPKPQPKPKMKEDGEEKPAEDAKAEPMETDENPAAGDEKAEPMETDV